jgi:hypothetical protein
MVLTARALKLFCHHILIGKLPRQAIRGQDQYGLHFAGRHRVAQAIEGWPIQGGTTVPFILIDMRRTDLVVVRLRIVQQSRHLRGNRLLALLAGTRDSGIKGCDFHRASPPTEQ